MTKTHLKLYIRVAVCSLLLNSLSAETDDCPHIIERVEWGARRFKATNYLVTPLPYVIIHQTRSSDCDSFDECVDVITGIQNSRMDDLHWNDIGDSFLIGGDGKIYEGTGWFMEGAHTHGYNKRSISIVFIGNFHSVYRNSTHEITVLKEAKEKSIKAAHDLIVCGKKQGYLRKNVKVLAARQVRPTTVNPGDLVFEQIKKWPEWSAEP